MKSSVVLLLFIYFLCVVVEVHSQTQTYPYVRFGDTGPALSNHSYIDLTTVGTSESNSVQCVTDLATCCSGNQGSDSGDWYFPNGNRVQSGLISDDIYRNRVAQRIFLHRRNNGANGIYQCTIETSAVYSDDNSDITTREIVYVGLYASGGDHTVYIIFMYAYFSSPSF